MPIFSEGAIWKAAPEIATPREPHSPAPEESDSLPFHRLIASAVQVYEALHQRSMGLEAENGRLQLAMLRQNIKLFDEQIGAVATPRPDAQPAVLSPCQHWTPRQEEGSEIDKNEVRKTNSNGSQTSEKPIKRVRMSDLAVEVEPAVSHGDSSATGLLQESSTKSGAVSHSADSLGSGLLGLLSNDLLPTSPVSPMSLRSPGAVTRTISEAQRSDIKKQHELRSKFTRLDREGRGQVESEWLEELMAKQQQQGRTNHVSNHLSSAFGTRSSNSSSVSESTHSHLPSCSDVILAVNGQLGSEERIMTFETFVALMTREDLQYTLDPDLWEKILQIRAMLARNEMTKMVARISHVSTQDLSSWNAPRKKRTVLLSYLDPVSLTAILVNALILGLSSDINADWDGWTVLEYFFTIFFLSELIIKVSVEGFEMFLFGKEALWNLLDAIIVFIAVADAILNIVATEGSYNMQLLTMMRLVRLARITRTVRLLRFKVFKELLLMIRGVFAGMRTLLWAIVLLSLYIFMLGMLMRQTMGRWCDSKEPYKWKENRSFCTEPHLEEYGEVLFSTLPRSCLTVFRCLTDGCSGPDGTPLIIHVFEDSHVGALIVVVYVFSFLFVTFGLFNLIMAIFVENTMETAKFDDRKRQQLRQMQAVHVAQRLQKLVLQFCKASTPGTRAGIDDFQRQGLSKRLRSLFDKLRGKGAPKNEETDLLPVGLEMEISRDLFSKVVADPMVEKLLDDLEVAVADPMDLFDTLDADGSGSIDVSELVKGLMKLRGTAEKSDMVACLLAVRAIQKSISGFEMRLSQGQKTMLAAQDRMDGQVRFLDKGLQKVVPGYCEALRNLKEEAAAKKRGKRHADIQPGDSVNSVISQGRT